MPEIYKPASITEQESIPEKNAEILSKKLSEELDKMGLEENERRKGVLSPKEEEFVVEEIKRQHFWGIIQNRE